MNCSSFVSSLRAESGCCFRPCGAQDGGTISKCARKDLAAWFEDDELLAGDQGKDGVGRGLGVFDQVAVDGETVRR